MHFYAQFVQIIYINKKVIISSAVVVCVVNVELSKNMLNYNSKNRRLG